MNLSLAYNIEMVPNYRSETEPGRLATETSAILDKVFPIISPGPTRQNQSQDFVKILESRARRLKKLVLPHLTKAVKDGLEVTFFGISMAVAMGSLWLLGPV